MARIIYGSIITDIKGSIGGITYQKNGSGTIARLKPRKTKTNTQKQRDQQPRLKEVQRNWNELSLTNKVLWNDFASVNNKIGLDGNGKVLTGYQWFLTINQNRLLIGEIVLLVPPVYEIVNPVTSVNLVQTDFSLSLRPNSAIDLNLYYPLSYCSFILNSVSKFNFNTSRLIVKGSTSSTIIFFDFKQQDLTPWEDYFNTIWQPNLGNNNFYLISYLRIISKTSGISSLAYTTIAKFIWDGLKYVIE